MRTPRRWLAIALSLPAPGLGHLYCGRPLAAGVAALAFELLAIPMTLAMLIAPGPALIAIALGMPAYILAVAAHAGRTARLATDRLTTKTRMAAAVVAFIVVTGAAGATIERFCEVQLGEPFRVASSAMLPTLLIGDHLFTDAMAYGSAEPQRGDIIVFWVARGDRGAVFPTDRHPDLPRDPFVKRIIGIPGDSIKLEGATLELNGARVTSPTTGETYEDELNRSLQRRQERVGAHSYEVLDDPARDGRTAFVTVEPGRYFVSGDNRFNSNDSSDWGTIHRDAIIGKATAIYWSWDYLGPMSLLDATIRWDRIGKLLD